MFNVRIVIICLSFLSFCCSTFDNCKFLVNANFILQQGGFHRVLMVEFHSKDHRLSTGEIKNLLMKWKIPSGLYIDPYELMAIQNHTQNSFEYHLNTNINVELPEYRSSEIIFYLKLGLTPDQINRISFPIHARYHKPQQCTTNHNSIEVVLEKPDFYVNAPKIWKCQENLYFWQKSWTKIDYAVHKEIESFIVPVGCLEHIPFVSFITIVITVLGCTWLGIDLIKK